MLKTSFPDILRVLDKEELKRFEAFLSSRILTQEIM